MVGHLTIARIAKVLGVAWNTANDAVLAEGRRVLIDTSTRFDGVAVLGVDENVWRHTRHREKYVTATINLTPIRDGTGTSRLLDMVEGGSKHVFKTWLASRPADWRAGVEVVAMDGFTGFKTTAAEELPIATAVMVPFHVAAQPWAFATSPTTSPAASSRPAASDPTYNLKSDESLKVPKTGI